MKKRLVMLLMMVMAIAVTADAQGWLGRLKDRAVDAAKRTVEYNVDRKTTEAVDDAMNPDMDKVKNKKSKDNDEAEEEVAEAGDDTPAAQSGESDFGRGSVMLGEDDFANEQMGAFPSK